MTSTNVVRLRILSHHSTVVPVLAVIVGVVFLTGCGSSSTTATSPTTVTRCSVTATGGGNVPAQGGSGSIAVSAARDCTWSASTEGTWLSIRSGSNGQGDGTVEFAASPNPDPATRRGAVILNDRRVDITQAASECTISLGETGATFPEAGGSGRVDIRTSSSLCTWTAAADASWIVLRADANGRGAAQLPFDVTATTGPPRTGTITISGQRFTVTQSRGCTFSINPSSYTASSSGANGAIAVTTAASCPWTASTNVSWLTLTQQAGNGPGTVGFSVAASTAQRSGTAVIAGQTFTVTQSASQVSCTYAVDPRSHVVNAAGGTVAVNVSTGSTCPWSASTPVPWIGLNGSGAFVGSGTVTFYVGPTSGGSRSATLTVAGESITVTQSAGCSYSIAPDSTFAPPSGGGSRTTVTTDAGCPWTAASDVSWIQVVAGTSGTGSGDVAFFVSANNGSPRAGTLTIATRTMTVNQGGACTYSVRPREIGISPDAQLLQIEVSTQRDCPWTATPDVQWMRVIWGGSGSGDGVVGVGVGQNDGKKRKGRITIGTETVTVEQRGTDNEDD